MLKTVMVHQRKPEKLFIISPKPNGLAEIKGMME